MCNNYICLLTLIVRDCQKALEVYPWAPGVRLGIALCHHKLGHYQKAKQAFHRVLQARNFSSWDCTLIKLITEQLKVPLLYLL